MGEFYIADPTTANRDMELIQAQMSVEAEAAGRQEYLQFMLDTPVAFVDDTLPRDAAGRVDLGPVREEAIPEDLVDQFFDDPF
jgi:hypothetical protein